MCVWCLCVYIYILPYLHHKPLRRGGTTFLSRERDGVKTC